MKVDENPTNALNVIQCVVIHTVCSRYVHHLREEDRSIMVETSAGFSSTFKRVPENCASYVLQPAEKHPLHCSIVFCASRVGGDRHCDQGRRGVHLLSVW